jgi:hypothetical protein
VAVGENATIDFLHSDGDIASSHYAFLVTEAEFDEIFGRILDRDLPYWADPGRSQPASNNTWDGGRGIYFDNPNGHLLEIITRPYGSGGTTTERPHPYPVGPVVSGSEVINPMTSRASLSPERPNERAGA